MIQRPPRSTRTDTLFPYTTLFRSFLHILHRTLAFLDGGLDLALGLGAQNLAQLHHHHVVGRRGGGGFQRHPGLGGGGTGDYSESGNGERKTRKQAAHGFSSPNSLFVSGRLLAQARSEEASCRERVCQYV